MSLRRSSCLTHSVHTHMLLANVQLLTPANLRDCTAREAVSMSVCSEQIDSILHRREYTYVT